MGTIFCIEGASRNAIKRKRTPIIIIKKSKKQKSKNQSVSKKQSISYENSLLKLIENSKISQEKDLESRYESNQLIQYRSSSQTTTQHSKEEEFKETINEAIIEQSEHESSEKINGMFISFQQFSFLVEEETMKYLPYAYNTPLQIDEVMQSLSTLSKNRQYGIQVNSGAEIRLKNLISGCYLSSNFGKSQNSSRMGSKMSDVYGFNFNGQMTSQIDIDHEYDMWIINKLFQSNTNNGPLSKTCSDYQGYNMYDSKTLPYDEEDTSPILQQNEIILKHVLTEKLLASSEQFKNNDGSLQVFSIDSQGNIVVEKQNCIWVIEIVGEGKELRDNQIVKLRHKCSDTYLHMQGHDMTKRRYECQCSEKQSLGDLWVLEIINEKNDSLYGEEQNEI